MAAFDLIPHVHVPDDEGNPEAARAFRKRWGWEPHEVVIIRGTFTAGMQEDVGNASTRIDKKGNAELLGGTGRRKLLEVMIVDWTLTESGRKVSVTPDSIKRLPANYSTPLLARCDEIAAAMNEEEQNDFFDTVNGHSPENSAAMKAFPMR